MFKIALIGHSNSLQPGKIHSFKASQLEQLIDLEFPHNYIDGQLENAVRFLTKESKLLT